MTFVCETMEAGAMDIRLDLQELARVLGAIFNTVMVLTTQELLATEVSGE